MWGCVCTVTHLIGGYIKGNENWWICILDIDLTYLFGGRTCYVCNNVIFFNDVPFCCGWNCWRKFIKIIKISLLVILLLWRLVCVYDWTLYPWCARQMFDKMTACELGNFLFFGAFAFGSSTACCLKRLLLTANLVDPFQPKINYIQSNG